MQGIGFDPLIVALTRPVMKAGVTYSALIFNAFVSLQTFILTNNLLLLVAMLASIHGVCALLCMYEPRFFDLALAWLRTCGSSGYSPFAVSVPNAKGRRKAKKPVEVVL